MSTVLNVDIPSVTTVAAEGPDQLVLQLRKSLDKLKIDHIIIPDTQNNISGTVNYISISNNESEFALFQSLSFQLQNPTKYSLIDVIVTEPDRTAFIINIYNILVFHAYVRLGIPTTLINRYLFFDQVSYNIGGLIYTLNDFENGILRSNRVAPYHRTRPFEPTDNRISSILQKCDPRIHFTLNCGAKSCPAVYLYSRDNLDNQLRKAAISFCGDTDHCRYDPDKSILYLSSIFQWYMEDFCSSKPNQSELIKTIITFFNMILKLKIN
jgi:hypothetical protein